MYPFSSVSKCEPKKTLKIKSGVVLDPPAELLHDDTLSNHRSDDNFWGGGGDLSKLVVIKLPPTCGEIQQTTVGDWTSSAFSF